MENLFGSFSPFLILAMIIGLVELAKKLGLQGSACLIASMVLGILFGVAFQLGALYPAINIWIQIVVYGILFGLAASGLYDVGKRFMPSAQG